MEHRPNSWELQTKKTDQSRSLSANYELVHIFQHVRSFMRPWRTGPSRNHGLDIHIKLSETLNSLFISCTFIFLATERPTQQQNNFILKIFENFLQLLLKNYFFNGEIFEAIAIFIVHLNLESQNINTLPPIDWHSNSITPTQVQVTNLEIFFPTQNIKIWCWRWTKNLDLF